MIKYSAKQARDLKLVVTLTRCLQGINRREVELISNYGITLGQFGVLDFLFHRGPHKICDIMKKTLASSGNITVVIDNLEKAGYAERIRDPEDRRSKLVTLTDNGVELMEELFPLHVDNLSQILSALSVSEKEQFRYLGKKLGLSLVEVDSND